MNAIRKIFIGATLTASMLFGAKVPGLPSKFTFSVNPFRTGTAWFLDASQARLYKENGKSMCSYLGDLVFPAYYEPRLDAYYCPGVTVRHIYSAMIDRQEGKCLGFVCGYDIAVPGGGPMLTTDHVEYCPDIIVTVAQQGRMDVVAAKTFKAAEDATPYFRNGALIDFVLVTQKELVDKCGGPRYRKQLNYWIGTANAPGSEYHTEVIDHPGWDGL